MKTQRELLLLSLTLVLPGVRSFASAPLCLTRPSLPKCRNEQASRPSSTSLGVWWFGGNSAEEQQADDSCELVAVRIERPTPNSRKIFGEITVPVPLDDVWAILTDYDRLSTHVPNLVESRIVQRSSGGQQGDGNFRCRLFQRGAQKIIGFEFGASVTMDMKESVMNDNVAYALPPQPNGKLAPANGAGLNRQRKIEFKCFDSFFFDGFDGEWKVTERAGENGEPETLLSYVVDVRPKGPVPVAALEWRIREDVPTNLRAVKKAAIEVGYEGVYASRSPPRLAPASTMVAAAARNGQRQTANKQQQQQPARRRMDRVLVQWDDSETMAAYLGEA